MTPTPVQQRLGLALESDDVSLGARASRLNAQPAPRLDAAEAWKPAEGASDSPGDAPFDLGAVLNEIFAFIGKAFGGASSRGESVGVQEKAEVSGAWSDGHLSVEGRAAAEAHARAQTESETFVDERGAGVRGGAEACVGASAEAAGRVCSDVGSIAGRARISAEAYARLYGEARAGADGLRAAGRAEAGVLAKAEADAQAELLGGLVCGTADARAESGAGAQATARTAVTVSPPAAVVDAKAGAFAGARAGFSAKGGVAGVGYGIEAEVWSGAGVKAEITAGLDDGKFRFRATLGVAVGVGACVTIDVEIDTRDLAAMVSGVLSAAAQLVGSLFGGAGAPLPAASSAGIPCGAWANQVLDGLGDSDASGSPRTSRTESCGGWSTALEGATS